MHSALLASLWTLVFNWKGFWERERERKWRKRRGWVRGSSTRLLSSCLGLITTLPLLFSVTPIPVFSSLVLSVQFLLFHSFFTFHLLPFHFFQFLFPEREKSATKEAISILHKVNTLLLFLYVCFNLQEISFISYVDI